MSVSFVKMRKAHENKKAFCKYLAEKHIEKSTRELAKCLHVTEYMIKTIINEEYHSDISSLITKIKEI
jgi:plasmid maintenance system antidote protein VapI